MENEVTLAARVAALETALEEHRRVLQRLLEVPAVRLHGLGPDGLAAISLKFTAPPDTHPKGGSENVEHPYDAALRRGDRLAQLARKDLGK